MSDYRLLCEQDRDFVTRLREAFYGHPLGWIKDSGAHKHIDPDVVVPWTPEDWFGPEELKFEWPCEPF